MGSCLVNSQIARTIRPASTAKIIEYGDILPLSGICPSPMAETDAFNASSSCLEGASSKALLAVYARRDCHHGIIESFFVWLHCYRSDGAGEDAGRTPAAFRPARIKFGQVVELECFRISSSITRRYMGMISRTGRYFATVAVKILLLARGGPGEFSLFRHLVPLSTKSDLEHVLQHAARFSHRRSHELTFTQHVGISALI